MKDHEKKLWDKVKALTQQYSDTTGIVKIVEEETTRR
jgi:hypothetical protein